MRLVFAGAVLAVGFGLAGAAVGGGASLPRSTTDRPDDSRLPQVHVTYAVPSDGEDRSLDLNGAVAASVGAFQRWLALKTGGATLRLDTYQGALDITFVRLERTDAEIAGRGAFVRDEVEALLRRGGHLRAGKVYAVYYDGSSTWSCGGGAWPPELTGQVAAMYLRGTPPGAPPCSSNAIAPDGRPGYFEFGMLHEIVHTLGYVAECAPHHTLRGHASDSTNDLMWAGDAPWQLPPRLDIGRDDYYGHGRADCPDLARSEYLTSSVALSVVDLTVGAARAGGLFVVRMQVALSGDEPPAGGVRCSASLGRRGLRPSVARFEARTAVCAWRLPRDARRKRLSGTIEAIVEGLSVRRGFARLVR